MNRVRDRGGAARFYPKKNGEKKMKFGQSGVAVVAVVIIVAASMGVGVATPVVASTRGVQPDSPLYGLSRLGESIRRVNDADQMKLRWGEYQQMVAKGKGLEYQAILNEFMDKMDNVIDKMPDNVAAKRDIIEWMQQQVHAVNDVRLGIMKEACEGIKGELENQPEVGASVEVMENEIENYKLELENASPEQTDNIGALVYLIRDRIESIIEDQHLTRRPTIVFIDIDNAVIDIDTTIKAQDNIPKENLIAVFEQRLSKFENELENKIQPKLENLPENAHQRTAIEALVNNAIKLENSAIQAENENKLGRALGLLNASNVLLGNADRILDSITGYVENVQHFVDNGFPQEYQRLSQIVDNLSDTAYRTGLKNMLQLAQSAFNDGNYQLAKWYLLRVEDFMMKLRQGMIPWNLPKHGNMH
jgi:hypothetical protein